ncbi:MAG: DUF4382 domain-containing protein [Dehalococcoidia bacterium]
MRRITGITVTLVLVALFVIGCAGGSGTQPEDGASGAVATTGTIEVRIHDAPPEYDVQEVWVTIDEVEIHKAEAEQNRGEEPVTPGTPTPPPAATATPAFDGASGTPVVEPTPPDEPKEEGRGGWITLAMSGTNPVDIIQYQDGLEALLASEELEAGKYTQVRLAISKVEVVYLDDSGSETQTAEAMLPSGKLKFTRPFDVVAGEMTVLSFDFVVDKSIVITGAGEIILKPVLTLDVAYEGGEDGEGEEPEEEEAGDKGQGAEKGKALDEENMPGEQGAEKGKAPEDLGVSDDGSLIDEGTSSADQGKAGEKGKPPVELPGDDAEDDAETES